MIGIMPRRYGLTSKQEEHGMPASSQASIGHCAQHHLSHDKRGDKDDSAYTAYGLELPIKGLTSSGRLIFKYVISNFNLKSPYLYRIICI